VISYSKRTLRQVIEEVFVRAADHVNPDNLDWNTIIRYINQAIKEIILLTYHHKEWAYIKRMRCNYLTTGFNVDRGMIKIVRVMFTANADYSGPWVEGRFAAPKEYWQVASALAYNPYIATRYTHDNPVYTIWGSHSAWIARDHIGESYPSIYYEPRDMYGIMEYYGFPGEVWLDDDLLPVPYEFEDYITLSCLYRLYSRTGVQEMASILYKRIETERMAILKLSEKSKELEKKVLDDFLPAVKTMSENKQMLGLE